LANGKKEEQCRNQLDNNSAVPERWFDRQLSPGTDIQRLPYQHRRSTGNGPIAAWQLPGGRSREVDIGNARWSSR
jgi:hypothetical protein